MGDYIFGLTSAQERIHIGGKIEKVAVMVFIARDEAKMTPQALRACKLGEKVADGVFAREGRPDYVVALGSGKPLCGGEIVYRDLQQPVWCDRQEFPGTPVGFVAKRAEGYGWEVVTESRQTVRPFVGAPYVEVTRVENGAMTTEILPTAKPIPA